MFTLAAHSPLQLLLDLPDNYIYVLLKLHCPLKKKTHCVPVILFIYAWIWCHPLEHDLPNKGHILKGN